MPLNTQTYDLEAERDKLGDEMEEYAEQQADAPVGSDGAAQAAQNGQRAERLRSGIAWALAEWDVDQITLAALTNGERRRVLDTVDATGWNTVDCYVAAGTFDTPYLAHDPNSVTQGDFEDTCQAVSDLHPAFVDWAESQIQQLSRMEGDEGKSYRELVLEKRLQADSGESDG